MDILAIRMWLANEYSFVITLLFSLLTIPVIAAAINRIRPLARSFICLISIAIIVLIFYNMLDIQKQYVDIPKVENLDTASAKLMLAQAGVDPNNIFITGYQGIPISENNSKVKEQSKLGIYKNFNNSLTVELKCIPYDSAPNDSNFSSENSVVFSEPQSNTTSSGVSIIIKDFEFFKNGFYYEMPIDENSFSFVDFDYGISGHFNYSRELTNQEYENWGHGGKILAKNGIEFSINATFFSTPDGAFAVELPESMPKGDYIYVLYQFINDEYCEARIPFTIN